MGPGLSQLRIKKNWILVHTIKRTTLIVPYPQFERYLASHTLECTFGTDLLLNPTWTRTTNWWQEQEYMNTFVHFLKCIYFNYNIYNIARNSTNCKLQFPNRNNRDGVWNALWALLSTSCVSKLLSKYLILTYLIYLLLYSRITFTGFLDYDLVRIFFLNQSLLQEI